MERPSIKIEDSKLQPMFEHIFRNAFGLPIIFADTPTNATMKANTWGKVKDVNTAIYIKFGDKGAIKITGTELS